MHIPDNYLSPGTCAVMGLAMVPVWTGSVRKVKAEISRSNGSMLGIGAAFSFLIMMFNIPVPGGTTAHALGGTLVAALLGPWSACVAVSVALFIQALLFGDGGVLAFGANSFNMAFVSPFLGYFVFRFLKAQLGGGRGGWISLGAASYLGLNMAAFCAAVELGIQPSLARDAAGLPLYFPYPLAIAIPGMMLPHLLVAGLVEAFFTVSVFAFVSKVSPESIYVGAKTRTLRIYGILAGLVCLSPLGLLAQGSAWGEWGVEEIRDLTWGGQRLGFVPSGLARGPSLKSAFQNYAVPGMPAWAGYVMSAAAGIALMVIAFKLLGLLKGRAAAVRDP